MLAAAAIARALAWAFTAGAASHAIADLLSYRIPTIVLTGIVAAVTIALLWSTRQVFSSTRIALWIEERIPTLKYAFVTSIDPAFAASGPLRRIVEDHDITGTVRRAALRSVLPSLVAAAIGGGTILLARHDALTRATIRSDAGRFFGNRNLPGYSLGPLRVTVIPPAYTGRSATSLDDPLTVAGLSQSTVRVDGPGTAAGVNAKYGTTAVPVRRSGSGWSLRFVISDKPAALVLTGGDSTRLIVIDSRSDDVPSITLSTPIRDTTLRSPRLLVALNARARDDVGLTRGYFEYLISSGAGESFSARLFTTPVRPFGGAALGGMRHDLDISSLKLSGGDVVSMRAVAFDGNNLSGPSMGVSETRTVRVARADEYDSLAVDAAAPAPVDSSAMSQRMLILMTEELVRKQPTLSRSDLVNQSTDIGSAEDRIRKRVYDILYETDSPEGASEHEEADSEIRAIANKDLKQAYDALWDAVRSLQIAEPAKALPPMRVALKALDRARLAQRVYLRGRPPRIVIDLGRVRLSGKDKGLSSVRESATSPDSLTMHASALFTSAIQTLSANRPRASAELTRLRLETLRTFPEFSASVEQIIADIHARRDYTKSLSRARSILSRLMPASGNVPSWAGG